MSAMPKGGKKAASSTQAGKRAVREAPSPGDARPPRPTKAEVTAEKFPNLEKNPALQRALAIHRAMAAGKDREAAEKMADEKYGPRSPKTVAKAKKTPSKRGERPEPKMRQRVQQPPPKRKR